VKVFFLFFFYFFCFSFLGLEVRAEDVPKQGSCEENNLGSGWFTCHENAVGIGSIPNAGNCDISKNHIINPKCLDNDLAEGRWGVTDTKCFPCLNYGIECKQKSDCGGGTSDSQNPLECRDVHGAKRCVFGERSIIIDKNKIGNVCIIGAEECWYVPTYQGETQPYITEFATCEPSEDNPEVGIGNIGRCKKIIESGGTNITDTGYDDELGTYIGAAPYNASNPAPVLANIDCRIYFADINGDFVNCNVTKQPSSEWTLDYSLLYNSEVVEFDPNTLETTDEFINLFGNDGKTVIQGKYDIGVLTPADSFNIPNLRYGFENGFYNLKVKGKNNTSKIDFAYFPSTVDSTRTRLNNGQPFAQSSSIYKSLSSEQKLNALHRFGVVEMATSQLFIHVFPPFLKQEFDIKYKSIIIEEALVNEGLSSCTKEYEDAGRCKTEDFVYKKGKDTGLSIDPLQPVKGSDESFLDKDISSTVSAAGSKTYIVYLYFTCPSKTGYCTLGNYRQRFEKTIATSGEYKTKAEIEYAGASNTGILGCGSNLDCINCIMRGENNERFTDIMDAIDAMDGGKYKFTDNIYTAVGCFDTSYEGTVTRILQISLGISGLLILFRMAHALTKFMAADNPEAKKEGVEIFTSAMIALLVILFGAVGLRFIGINVFRVMSPGTIETE
jgi:hypothetical protein